MNIVEAYRKAISSGKIIKQKCGNMYLPVKDVGIRVIFHDGKLGPLCELGHTFLTQDDFEVIYNPFEAGQTKIIEGLKFKVDNVTFVTMRTSPTCLTIFKEGEYNRYCDGNYQGGTISEFITNTWGQIEAKSKKIIIMNTPQGV